MVCSGTGGVWEKNDVTHTSGNEYVMQHDALVDV